MWFEFRRSAHLPNRCLAHAAADAQGGQAEAVAAPFHFVEQGNEDAGAGAADGVTQADAGAVDVGDFPVETEEFLAGKVLRSEGLVNFNEVEILQGKTGALQGLA